MPNCVNGPNVKLCNIEVTHVTRQESTSPNHAESPRTRGS